MDYYVMIMVTYAMLWYTANRFNCGVVVILVVFGFGVLPP